MFPIILERVAQGQLNLADLETTRFTTDQATEAFKTAVEQPAGFLKSMITF
jgi:threonine dehydrogenase-like Zn-dependent dehydrogenase